MDKLQSAGGAIGAIAQGKTPEAPEAPMEHQPGVKRRAAARNPGEWQ